MHIDPDLLRLARTSPDDTVDAMIVCSEASDATVDALRAAGFEVESGPDPDFGMIPVRVRAGLLRDLQSIEGVESIAAAPEQRAF